MGRIARFKSDQRGNVALMFGLVMIPFFGLVGAAIDYGRASYAHSKAQTALDRAALSIVKLPITASQADMDKIAKAAVENTFGFDTGTRSTSGIIFDVPTVSRADKTVTVTISGSSDSTFMQLLGFQDTKFNAAAKAEWNSNKIELALVLDNTDSMKQSPGGTRKIDALKQAANQLLLDLKSAAIDSDTVKVSIVPFDTEVRLDPEKYRSTSLFNWARTNTDPAKWTGYVFDRYNSYATSDAAPSAAIPDSLFPAPQTTTSQMSGSLQMIQPLTTLFDSSNYDALKQVVSGMQPRGYTNIALGAMWGLATLSPSEPFSEAQPISNTKIKKYMVIVTDGYNTKNHVNGNESNSVSQIDTKTLSACSAAKDFGIQVFTIRLVDGYADLLQKCASSPDNYFDVQNASDLSGAFKKITGSILGTRISS